MLLDVFIYHKMFYLDRHISANSVDPDQTAPWEQSDQGLHCLPLNQSCIHSTSSYEEYTLRK